MSVTYTPGRPPTITLDCRHCEGTGIGQGPDPSTSRCQTCRGRGYFRHVFDPDCDCLGCRQVRGEVDEDGNAIEGRDE